MKSLFKYLFAIPLVFLIVELIILVKINDSPKITPYANSHQYLQQLTNTLQLSGLKYQQLSLFDYRQEAEFVVNSDSSSGFKVIISTARSPLYQVAALQKLIKIANIEGRRLSFVDLSSRRPYATF
jgi:hypothetical protein